MTDLADFEPPGAQRAGLRFGRGLFNGLLGVLGLELFSIEVTWIFSIKHEESSIMRRLKILAFIVNAALVYGGVLAFEHDRVFGVTICVIAVFNILAFSAFKLNHSVMHFEKKAREEKKRIETLKKVLNGKR